MLIIHDVIFGLNPVMTQVSFADELKGLYIVGLLKTITSNFYGPQTIKHITSKCMGLHETSSSRESYLVLKRRIALFLSDNPHNLSEIDSMLSTSHLDKFLKKMNPNSLTVGQLVYTVTNLLKLNSMDTFQQFHKIYTSE